VGERRSREECATRWFTDERDERVGDEGGEEKMVDVAVAEGWVVGGRTCGLSERW